jgi:vacuolar-type H+-ATPase subunit H
MRKLMVAVAAVAGLALTAGCQRNEPQEERRELAKAQQEAQKDIAEARQEANEERAEIQREEHEEIADARREVSEQEREVYEADRDRARDPRDDTMAATAVKETVQGRVRSTTGDSLVLVVPGKANSELKLKTDDNTRVTRNNRDVELDDFKEGTEVRASYVADGEDLVARDVVILTPVKK